MAELRESAITLLSSTTVSLAASGTTELYTVPEGKTCILAYAELEVGGDAVSTDISIGRNGATTDFIGTTQCDNADADGDVIVLAPVPSATPATLKTYAAGIVIEAEVANHAGNASNTLSLFGFLY